MAAPWVLLVQLRQVRSSAAGNARPSGVEPVSTSWRFGTKPEAGDLAALAQRAVEAKLVVVAVQLVETGRDGLTLEILPRAVADAVACVDRRLASGLLGAQICAPGFPSAP